MAEFQSNLAEMVLQKDAALRNRLLRPRLEPTQRGTAQKQVRLRRHSATLDRPRANTDRPLGRAESFLRIEAGR